MKNCIEILKNGTNMVYYITLIQCGSKNNKTEFVYF